MPKVFKVVGVVDLCICFSVRACVGVLVCVCVSVMSSVCVSLCVCPLAGVIVRGLYARARVRARRRD